MTFELRPYQQEAVALTLADLLVHKKVGMIMPTGSGKTEVFSAIADRFVKLHPGSSVLVLSHLSLLTQQTVERFRLRLPHLNVGVFQADQLPDQNAHVIVGTMQTSRDGKKSDFLKWRANKEVGLVIIDEAHYLDNPSYNKTLDQWFPEAKQLGCTATPFRSGALMTSYFDKISYSISLQELIDDGYLVPPKLIEVTYDDKELTDVMSLTAKLYLEKEKGQQALVFMTSIDDAKAMRNVLDNHGVKARAITSELVGEERDKILAAFRRGEIDVLTTVNVLTAGFDSPNVSAIFMPYPTQSPTTYLQRVGRGLRPCPEIGKTECRIYVCGDTPSVRRELYKRVHDLALLGGSKKRGITTFQEDLEYNEADKSSEIYHWTQTVCETVIKMEALGMQNLADRLNHKKFPKRFLSDITTFAAALPGAEVPVVRAQAPATQTQLEALKRAGFTQDTLKGITKGEAATMLVAVNETVKAWIQNDPYTVAKGPHGGKHVSDLPRMYRSMVKSKYPQSGIAQLMHQWERQGGRYKT